jgi:threonine/homoserine/homoserine lactone efflux protein
MASIRWGSVGTLVLTSLPIMGSPGPTTISLTAAGSAYGVRRSAGYLIGIVAGTMSVLVAVAMGLTATLLTVPALRAILIVISAAYIVWLAYHIAIAPPVVQQAAPEDAPSLPGGALLGICNPKAWVAIAAVFTSTHLTANAVTDATAKTAVLAVMVVLIHATWLIAGAVLAPLLSDPRRSRVINVVMAAALVGAAILAVVHQL